MISDNSYSNTGVKETSLSGNWKFFILLFILTSIQVTSTKMAYQKKTFQKGGILFEDIGGAQVNGEYMTYKRVADTSKLELGITSGSDLAVIYHNLCTRVIHSIKVAKEEEASKTKKKEAPPPIHKTELIVSAIKYTIKEADRVCKNLQARLPEIRNWNDHGRVLQLMQERNIWDIKAGIEYEANLNQFSYMTDKTPADVGSVFARINYGGDWTDGDHDANWHHDHYMRNQAS